MVDVTRATPEDRARYVNALADRAATRRLIDAHRGEFVSLRADAYREASEAWDRLTRAAKPAPPEPEPEPDPPDAVEYPEPLSYRIRRWAAIHGVECPKRGKIPARVMIAWHEEHPDEPVPPGVDVRPMLLLTESIRDWHARTGCRIPCPAQGRIPFDVVAAWRAANPDAPRQRCEDQMDRSRVVAPPTGPASSPAPPTDTPRATTPEPPQRPATAPAGTPTPPTATDGTGRRCAGCGNLLSRYNKQDRCSSCAAREADEFASRLPDPVDEEPDEDPPARRPSPGARTRSGNYDHAQPERARVPRPAGVVVMSDGGTIDLTTGEARRDDEGRIVCRGCGVYISRTLGCGCDPGELDDDGHPLDPRYAHLTIVDIDEGDAAAS